MFIEHKQHRSAAGKLSMCPISPPVLKHYVFFCVLAYAEAEVGIRVIR